MVSNSSCNGLTSTHLNSQCAWQHAQHTRYPSRASSAPDCKARLLYNPTCSCDEDRFQPGQSRPACSHINKVTHTGLSKSSALHYVVHSILQQAEWWGQRRQFPPSTVLQTRICDDRTITARTLTSSSRDAKREGAGRYTAFTALLFIIVIAVLTSSCDDERTREWAFTAPPSRHRRGCLPHRLPRLLRRRQPPQAPQPLQEHPAAPRCQSGCRPRCRRAWRSP